MVLKAWPLLIVVPRWVGHKARLPRQVLSPGQPRPPRREIGLQFRLEVLGEGHLDRFAGLGPGGRDLEPPAIATLHQVTAELELGKVGQPQRAEGETGDHEPVAVKTGALA